MGQSKENDPEGFNIPITEEELHVSKVLNESGKIRIKKEVEEEEVAIDQPLVEEHIEVERVTLNKYVDEAPPAVRQEGDTTVISVVEEVLVKRFLVKEELRIIKNSGIRNFEDKIKLRKEHVKVERIEPE